MRTKNVNRLLNIISCAGLQVALILSFSMVAYADGGKDVGVAKVASWLFDQIGWLGMIAAVWGGGRLLIARNFVAGVGVLVVGGLFWYLTANPTVLQTLGAKIAEIAGLTSLK